MCLHYLGKFEVSDWDVNAVIKYAFEWFYSIRSLAVYNWPDLNPVDYTVWSVFQGRVYHTKISDVDELKQRIISEWATLSHTVIDSAVKEWPQRLHTCVHAGGGHFEHTLK